jgi:allophanate hydrolase subunit 1
MRLHLNREWARLVPELVSRLRSRSEMRKVRWSPAARSLTVEFDPSLRQHEVLDSLNAPAREATARRAYELYLARGATPGYDLDDWLAAERELMTEAKR